MPLLSPPLPFPPLRGRVLLCIQGRPQTCHAHQADFSFAAFSTQPSENRDLFTSVLTSFPFSYSISRNHLCCRRVSLTKSSMRGIISLGNRACTEDPVFKGFDCQASSRKEMCFPFTLPCTWPEPHCDWVPLSSCWHHIDLPASPSPVSIHLSIGLEDEILNQPPGVSCTLLLSLLFKTVIEEMVSLASGCSPGDISFLYSYLCHCCLASFRLRLFSMSQL